MKAYLAILVVLLISCIVSYNVGKKSHGMAGYGHAAEWGCYAGSEQACTRFTEDKDIADCRENALTFCPKAGESFKAFMMQSYSKFSK